MFIKLWDSTSTMGSLQFPYFILCFIHLLLFPFSTHSSSLVPFCNHEDSFALLQLNNSFALNSEASDYCLYVHSTAYPKTLSWKNGTNCCLWDGVTCDISGYVIGLDLSCSWLVGELHSNNTLFQLTHLRQLNLSNNYFNESAIPSRISHLSKLVSLDLSMMQQSLKLDPLTWEMLILNATDLRELFLDGVDMSFIEPSSLSLLKNFSSSLVSLHLRSTGLQENLSIDDLFLPNLQELYLSFNNLEGELPKSNWSTSLRYLDLSHNSFSGEISNSIGQSKSLTYLDLSYSKFEGPIPLSLGNLTHLTSLSFESNNFSGEIPLSFGNLTHLTYLSLKSNSFSGEIPLSFGNLTHLTYLSLKSNNFSGEIPPSLSNLQHLLSLDLSGNNLGGRLPSSLFELSQLSKLDCSGNKLVGSIPEKINHFSNLSILDLSDNFLSGTVPQGIFSLPSLVSLNLGNNQLTGPIGEFSTSSLQSCDISNNKLQGNIPKSMFHQVNLTNLRLSSNILGGFLDFHQLSKVQNLRNLDLSGNGFHGRITGNSSLFSLDLSHNFFTSVDNLSLSTVKVIDLSFNMLQGYLPIPGVNTEFFSVSNNKLIGDISSAICNASSLRILNLSHNNLSGMIPQCLGMFQSLLVLDLKMNNLSGTILRNFSQGNALETVNLNGNRLEGLLPPSLTRCKNLKVLDLGKNIIEDTFPSWLEPLQELQVLILQANKFHGVLNQFKMKHSFPKLRIFDISNNYFSGPLPATYIKNFKGMMNTNDGPTRLQYMQNNIWNSPPYNDSVMLTMKGNNVELQRILTTFTTIDLSNNKFDGGIPDVIGELNSLIGLNLSHNRITGNIPRFLGNLTSLEWLDLSSNQLVGNIPSELTNINFLSVLNLSENQLTGIIPTGKQFNTFQNDSYEGNPGLCGLPLTKSCNDDGKQPQDPTNSPLDEKLGFGWKAVVVGYACGFVFGVLLGCIAFLTGKPQWLVRLFSGRPHRRVRKRQQHANRRGMI